MAEQQNFLWIEALKELYRRAAVDGAFRQRCLENPTAALEEVAGRPVPTEVHMPQFLARGGAHQMVLPESKDASVEALPDLDQWMVFGAITSSGPSTC